MPASSSNVKPAECGSVPVSPDWLPVRRMLERFVGSGDLQEQRDWPRTSGWKTSGSPSTAIIRPSGRTMSTCSFKETEAYQRLRPRSCRERDSACLWWLRPAIPPAPSPRSARTTTSSCCFRCPTDNIGALWFDGPLNPCVKLISCEKGGDYFDAIHLSDLALKRSRLLCRGRRQERRTPRRHGLHGTFGRDDHRPHPRLLFPGRGQRYGRHCRLGGQHAPYRGRPFRQNHR